jgi:hypothetical protein
MKQLNYSERLSREHSVALRFAGGLFAKENSLSSLARVAGGLCADRRDPGV